MCHLEDPDVVHTNNNVDLHNKDSYYQKKEKIPWI